MVSLADQDRMVVRYPQQTGVTCAYRVKLIENGGAIHLEPTNASQPEEFCPTGRLASSSQSKSSAAATLPAVQANSDRGTTAKEILGHWLMSAGGVLVIEPGEWRHPTKGTADIAIVGNDRLVVQYAQQTHVKCAYRVIVLDEGKALELVPTLNLQPDEYCPAGRLTALH